MITYLQIINQQKQAYEAEMSLSIGGKKTGALIMTSTIPMTTKAEQSPVPELELSSVESTPSSECIPPEEEVTVLTDDDDDDEEVEDEDSSETNATNAKNIEIRRMSATDEGDKVLEGVWDSPEKEKGSEGKTPLQMVQSIVSKIEEAKLTSSTVTTAITTSAPPAWTTIQGGQRPLLHSQKHMANDTPPTSRVVTSIVPPPPQQKAPMSQNMTVMAPQLVQPGGQQFMQLVNTINGPMLMQAIPQAPPQIQIHDPSKGNNKKKTSPGSTPQVAYQQSPNIMQAGSGGPMPILVSPTPMMTSQTSPTGQHVLISHPSPGSGVIQGAPQFVLNQPAVIAPNQVFLSANGTLVAMPAAPTAPVVYNQLPDGTLVQMQSPTLMPTQQTVFTTNGSFVINNGGQQVSPNGGQIITNTGGTYIMTPTGLVQTVPTHATPSAANSAPSGTGPNQTTLEPQPGPSSSSMERKDSTEKSEDSDDDDDQDDSDDEPKIVKFVQTDEDDDDDEDTSDEEVPLAKKKSPTSLSLKDTKNSGNKNGKVKTSSPKTYLQSNKVDSSGLQATPPHPHEDSESSMKRLSSPEASVSTSMRDDALDTSGSTDGGSGPSSSTKSSKRKRKRNADELIKDNLVQSDDEGMKKEFS